MAATANVNGRLFHSQNALTSNQVPITASTEYFEGAFGFFDATTGLLVKVSTNNIFAGVIQNHQDSITPVTTADTLLCNYDYIEEFTLSGATQVQAGDPVYASDDNTLTFTASTNALIGRMISLVAANTITVKLFPAN